MPPHLPLPSSAASDACHSLSSAALSPSADLGSLGPVRHPPRAAEPASWPQQALAPPHRVTVAWQALALLAPPLLPQNPPEDRGRHPSSRQTVHAPPTSNPAHPPHRVGLSSRLPQRP